MIRDSCHLPSLLCRDMDKRMLMTQSEDCVSCPNKTTILGEYTGCVESSSAFITGKDAPLRVVQGTDFEQRTKERQVHSFTRRKQTCRNLCRS